MRKIFACLLAVVMLVALAGCGNMSWGLGEFTFRKVHVDTHHYSGCFTIKKWHDNSSGIEVKTEEVGTMFLSEGVYVLLEGDEPCPFCGNTEEQSHEEA